MTWWEAVLAVVAGLAVFYAALGVSVWAFIRAMSRNESHQSHFNVMPDFDLADDFDPPSALLRPRKLSDAEVIQGIRGKRHGG